MLPILRIFRFFLKSAPIAFLGVLLILPLYDWISPASFVDEGLAEYKGQLRICLGAGSFFRTPSVEPGSDSYRQRAYILVPRVLFRPALVVVNYFPDRRVVSTNESTGGLVFVVVVVAVCSWAIWLWWIRPIRQLGWRRFRDAV